ncbi:hypothetical protein [Pseudomonas sp. TTU2014-080ASC]|uniref:hypothetical protein n=1 Tax=Pseudomonas sp. TTU2014-080ASC TaxID=1729724 RepID=UPI0007185C69|nr:hypothetical protein [Pseudomonas sp. TTU2014-080ASC]KRW58845.1 hypothetical protein AO726_15120 [Pseudomonas sp. TTU2014-080ASC]
MMYYGGWDTEEMFDATQWFTSGMYKPRNIEADGSASHVTMLRTQEPELTDTQISELGLAAGQAFGMSSYDELDIEPFVLSEPDLSNRYRYAYSAFAKPNQPEDYFYLYLDVLNRQFVATLSVDALHGGEISGKYIQEVHADQPADAEHIKAFTEIAEAERKARRYP